jgi:hypothetical protein
MSLLKAFILHFELEASVDKVQAKAILTWCMTHHGIHLVHLLNKSFIHDILLDASMKYLTWLTGKYPSLYKEKRVLQEALESLVTLENSLERILPVKAMQHLEAILAELKRVLGVIHLKRSKEVEQIFETVYQKLPEEEKESFRIIYNKLAEEEVIARLWGEIHIAQEDKESLQSLLEEKDVVAGFWKRVDIARRMVVGEPITEKIVSDNLLFDKEKYADLIRRSPRELAQKGISLISFPDPHFPSSTNVILRTTELQTFTPIGRLYMMQVVEALMAGVDMGYSGAWEGPEGLEAELANASWTRDISFPAVFYTPPPSAPEPPREPITRNTHYVPLAPSGYKPLIISSSSAFQRVAPRIRFGKDQVYLIPTREEIRADERIGDCPPTPCPPRTKTSKAINLLTPGEPRLTPRPTTALPIPLCLEDRLDRVADADPSSPLKRTRIEEEEVPEPVSSLLLAIALP